MKTLTFLLCFLVTGHLHAQVVAGDFMKCAGIANDAQRLSCYDRMATELIELGAVPRDDTPVSATPPAAPSQRVATPPAAAPDTAGPAVTATRSEPGEVPPQSVATPPAVAPDTVGPTVAAARDQAGESPPAAQETSTAASASSSVDQFGAERTEDVLKTELKEINSRLVGEFSGWSGDTVFRLENGQVWQQARDGRLVWRGVESPMVTIKRGFMGSYRLSIDGVNKQVNVKRIK